MMIFGTNNMEWHEIKVFGDLPKYGKLVVVLGKDNKMYGDESYHICCMDDLEDGYDFRNTGFFYWLTENGAKITDVFYWCDIPTFIEPKIYKRILKINKIREKIKDGK